jgi:hypothetical protein
LHVPIIYVTGLIRAEGIRCLDRNALYARELH